MLKRSKRGMLKTQLLHAEDAIQRAMDIVAASADPDGTPGIRFSIAFEEGLWCASMGRGGFRARATSWSPQEAVLEVIAIWERIDSGA